MRDILSSLGDQKLFFQSFYYYSSFFCFFIILQPFLDLYGPLCKVATDSCTGRGSSPFLLNLVSLFFINHPWHHCTTVHCAAGGYPQKTWAKERGVGLESPTMDAWWQKMYWECSQKASKFVVGCHFCPKIWVCWESVVHGWNQILVKKDVKKMPT